MQWHKINYSKTTCLHLAKRKLLLVKQPLTGVIQLQFQQGSHGRGISALMVSAGTGLVLSCILVGPGSGLSMISAQSRIKKNTVLSRAYSLEGGAGGRRDSWYVVGGGG